MRRSLGLISATPWRRWTHAAIAQRVLVMHKTSRLDLARRRQPDEEALRRELSAAGEDFYSFLLQCHEEQASRLAQIHSLLRAWSLPVRTCTRETYNQSDVDWADLVLSAGGDGNFLITASRILTPTKLMAGLNTDPSKSEGFLCLRSSSESLSAVLTLLLEGRLGEVQRARVRVCLGEEVLPVRALNEVFIGEKNQAHSSYYELSVDGGEGERQKSSGLLVYTGSGSTSWAYNINRVSSSTVDRVVSLMRTRGLSSSCEESVRDTAKQIANDYNAGVVFPGDEQQLAFVAREPIVRRVFEACTTRGFAQRVRVTSRSWNAQLVVDGQFLFDLPFGATIECTLTPDDSLRTATNLPPGIFV